MDLLLWRHAEAEDGVPDLARRLTPRGEKQAQRMAAWLATHGPKKIRVLSSPARRCRQTAQALGHAVTTDERLGPAAGVADLLAAIGWPDGGDESAPGPTATLVVGHQPTLGRTAALLLGGHEADWSIRKGALWWFSQRTRAGETQTVLRAALSPEFV